MRRHVDLMAEAEDGEIVEVEYRFRTAAGKWTWVLSSDTVFKRDENGNVCQYIASFIDIDDLKRGEAEAARSLRNLSALRQIDLAVLGSVDLNITVNIILEQVMNELEVDASSILLAEPHTKVLKYLGGRGFLTSRVNETRLRAGEGVAGQVFLERKERLIPDLSKAGAKFVRAQLVEEEGFVSYFGSPLIAKGKAIGVLEIFSRNRLEANSDWIKFLEMLAGQTAIALDSAALFESLERANLDLQVAYDSTLEGWVKALDLRDHETEGHTIRVANMTVELGRIMGISEEELIHVRRGALLHDIGKMAVPDEILLKPGKLTKAEWEVMRQHPANANEWLKPISYLRPALDIPKYHHERWDGEGYPYGLKGENIPLAARVFAVVDVWDALTSDRPYRKAWEPGKVAEHIRAGVEGHFDPQIVEEFFNSGLVSEAKDPQ